MPPRDSVSRKQQVDPDALRRAVSDVMDGTITKRDAVASRGVSETALDKALREAGWKYKR